MTSKDLFMALKNRISVILILLIHHYIVSEIIIYIHT